MQGIETITGRIASDAQAEIDRVLADAEAQAAQIRSGYALRAQKERDDILTKGARSAEERRVRLVNAASLASRNRILAAKQEMLEQAFGMALDRLCGLPEDTYVDLLAGLAAKAADTGTEAIILNPADRARCGEQVTAKANETLAAAGRSGALTLSEQTRPIRGGLILSDGAVEVNCALETLVRLSRGELTGEVVSLLF